MNTTSSPNAHSTTITFNRHELAGAFGDIGTDLPLLTGVIIAANLDPSGILTCFGALLILTGLYYRIPMPVQPMKAMAALVIAQGIGQETIAGAGVAIAIIVLILTLTGLLQKIAELVPPSVVRGIQVGLGLKLSLLALTRYLPEGGALGIGFGIVALILLFLMRENRRIPPALIVIPLGMLWAAFFNVSWQDAHTWFQIKLPRFQAPSWTAIMEGTLLLALPQLPLSLSNSVIATEKLAKELFPHAGVSVRKIGFTYSLGNILVPFFGGFPACHGAGGLAGHYAMGGRTGGSTIIYGSFYLILGLFFSNGFHQIIMLFPLCLLGIILLFEGLNLIQRILVVVPDEKQLIVPHIWLSVAVAFLAIVLPCGFLISTILGIIVHTILQTKPRAQTEIE